MANQRCNVLTRADFLRQLGAVALAGTASRPAFAAEKANVLVIVTDDQGYADLSAYSHAAADVSTPNMDRIAAQGLLFTRAYVAGPVCSPSRAAWNTGRYPQRWDANSSWTPGLPRDGKTIAEYFQSAGYATAKVGKNDFGRSYHSQDGREYPLNHGYDEFLGFSSHAHDYFLLTEEVEQKTPDPHGRSAALGPLFENRGRRSFEGGYLTDIFTNSAIQFLKRHRKQPFFLHLAYNAVHTLVHEVPDRYLEQFGVKPIPKYDPATMGKYVDYYDKYAQLGSLSDEEMRKYYLANLACLDDNIGRLLDALDALGLAENTLVVFFSDNGGTQHGGGGNRPLRGAKSSTFEGGIRVPFMMRWPGRLPAGRTYSHRISTLDLLPTCLEAAGIPLDDSVKLDGQSFLEAIQKGVTSPTSGRPLFWLFRDRWAVLSGDWKLVRSDNPGGPRAHQILYEGDQADLKPALFNLATDEAEQHDVSTEYPAIAERLTRLFNEWRYAMRKEAQSAETKNGNVRGVEYAGLTGQVGADANARRVKELRITEPGVYENILVDGEWGQHDLVRILSDDVVLRNCTVRYGQRDGIEVYARNVRIENCHIHHLLNQTFLDQKDSHGITGRPLNLVVRNTEISHVSGDAIQFDPGRKSEPYPWDKVLVENCFLWTGPLDADYAGFHKGERPGENAFDSKVDPEAPRASIVFRKTLMKGWGHGQIGNGAALNLKEQIHATVENCVFVENDIAFRCRGTLGSAWVTARNNAVYQTSRVFRLEHYVKNVKISGLALGEGIGQVFDNAPGPGEGFEDKDRRTAPPLAAWPYTRLPVAHPRPANREVQ